MNNNQPSSFATLSTRQTYDELCLLLKSIELHHKHAPVFILADSYCKENLENTPFNLELKIFNSLDLYSNLTRFQMEEAGIVTEFWNNKTKVIEWALDNQEDVMFLDCDVFVVFQSKSHQSVIFLAYPLNLYRPQTQIYRLL